MKNIIIFLLIAVLAAAGYQYYQAEHGAYETYKKFATTLFQGKWDAAREMTTGAKAAAQYKLAESFYKGYYGQFRASSFGPKYELLSKTKSPDGKRVNLTLTQTVRIDAPGVTTITGTGEVTFKHMASLIREGNVWKIESLMCSYVPPAKTSKSR